MSGFWRGFLFSGMLAGSFALGWKLLPTQPAADSLEHDAVDIGFAQFMSLHHQQAIGMAQLMLDGRPTPLKRLAQSIAYSQLLELGQMQGWLTLWRQPLLPKTRSMDWMLVGKTPPDEQLKRYLIDCERSPTGMPGLATLADLEQLRQLDGKLRDEWFLRLMLAHHQGGIPMAQFALENAGSKSVRDLARLIILEQSRESDRIQRTLHAMSVEIAP